MEDIKNNDSMLKHLNKPCPEKKRRMEENDEDPLEGTSGMHNCLVVSDDNKEPLEVCNVNSTCTGNCTINNSTCVTFNDAKDTNESVSVRDDLKNYDKGNQRENRRNINYDNEYDSMNSSNDDSASEFCGFAGNDNSSHRYVKNLFL